MIVFGEKDGCSQREQLEHALELITRELAVSAVSFSRSAPDAHPAAVHASDMSKIAAKAEAIYKGRRKREKVFEGFDIFADPAWDILLDLFVARVQHRQISVSSATIASSVAPTTALRWVTSLAERGLVRRFADPFDRRRAFLELTDRGFELTAQAVADA